ncbi:caspase domain-containing protein [Streptomyces sp. NPDC058297]|uniref:caspase family protein n=1 Tax=Streptomyces sp. NPDC058297 TaxID=3346433 RepID=UPI0036E7661B
MTNVYALFVGIDKYPGAPLNGCVTDVMEAENWLRRQAGPACDIRVLHDEQATRAAMLHAIHTHLGQGRPGDSVLLWFSGHGSETATDDPREATGMCQALVCHDSLDDGGQALLQDSELGLILDGFADRGVHVLAVLDCCHSGGATRESAPGVAARGVAWRPWWRTQSATGSRDGGGQGAEPQRHVLLAACRPQERAHEGPLDGRIRGYYSHAMLGALEQLGHTATYGTVHAVVEERVRRLSAVQHPELRGPEDGRFLSGDAVPTSAFLLRLTGAGWEVNCGSVHGLLAVGAEFTLLPETGSATSGAPRVVVVREIRPESALVEPAGWQPGAGDRESVHAVTPSALAFPPAAVSVSGQPEAVRMVAEAISGEPMLSSGGTGLSLHVDVGDAWAQVHGGDGHPLAPMPLRTPADAARVAGCLAHIAHWHHLRELANPDPWLSALVRVTVDETPVGTVRLTAGGESVCSYTHDGQEPQVMVRIHNDSDRPLWCALLDLTDSYACTPSLYEGDFIAAHKVGLARRGEPVWLRLPPGRNVVRGASTRDWLKVIVAENEFNLAPFRLPAWTPGTSPSARGGAGRGGDGGLLRLGAAQGSRDAGGPAQSVGRWGTAHVPVRTVVP